MTQRGGNPLLRLLPVMDVLTHGKHLTFCTFACRFFQSLSTV